MTTKEIYILPIEMSNILYSQIDWLRMARKDNNKESFPETLLSNIYYELVENITLRQHGMVDFLAYYDSLKGDYFVIKDSYTGECYWRCPESVSASLRGILSSPNK